MNNVYPDAEYFLIINFFLQFDFFEDYIPAIIHILNGVHTYSYHMSSYNIQLIIYILLTWYMCLVIRYSLFNNAYEHFYFSLPVNAII